MKRRRQYSLASLTSSGDWGSIAGLPKFTFAGLSPIGPFVAYEHEEGELLSEVTDLTASQAVSVAIKIVTTVVALHDLECEHGDLAAKNILYRRAPGDICILDAFDISPVGDGRVRTPVACPANWETLNQLSLDRYATVKVVRDLLGPFGNGVAACLAVLDEELSRPQIETLEVALFALQATGKALSEPPKPSFAIATRYPDKFAIDPDGDGYWLTSRRGRTDDQATEYALTGVRHQLVLTVKDDVLIDVSRSAIAFGELTHASSSGTKLRLTIVGASDGSNDAELLLSYVRKHVPVAAPVPKATPRKAEVRLDVPRHWRKLLELEESDRIEVEIVQEVAFRGGLGVYTFRSQGGNFDFDPDSLIQAYSGLRSKVGDIDLEVSDLTSTLAIRGMTRRLYPGDVIGLVDRREQTSIDRRSRAVSKILNGGAAVPNLIGYFSAEQQPVAIDFGTTIEAPSLERYGLNRGQSAAFEKLLRHGPVGLLQGPPGTGKTHFIASLVHWLLTEGGARRILIASQSHEAVNNAIEALVNLYKNFGGKPNLLRIGSKGISEKIKPYHSAELRARYKTRFESALKARVSILTSDKGVSKRLVADVCKLDDEMGEAARLCLRLRRLLEEAPPTAAERDRQAGEMRRAEAAVKEAAERIAGLKVACDDPIADVERAFAALLLRHKGSSEADLVYARNALALAREWGQSMGSVHRNFDEFLAKTRSIVTATCVGVGETKIRIEAAQFDWVIVDEAARCTSSELAVPIQLARRVLLVGDHFQLKPMIERSLVDRLEEEFPGHARSELTRSDFERAFDSAYGEKIGERLTEQYRMNDAICSLVSECFYEPHQVRLTTSPDRKSKLAFPGTLPPVLSKPICWVDTAVLSNAKERQLPNSTTFHNEGEVEAVIRCLDVIAQQEELVTQLLKGDEETPIGVICMYSGQKQRIEVACAGHAFNPRFRKLVRVDTVDAYQGKENSIVIVSLVRTNGRFDPGHIREPNRCNVAMSRARERLIVIGSAPMWSDRRQVSPMRQVHAFSQRNAVAAHVVKAETI
ncbi:AAA domain-containing protein [Panacagrimonas perspica]|uniref:AAA domain-containing protein n=2 Tax=Panacagrimonas perspica TaxID=381431 RepID=A0A4R7NTX3_9GAMM|nr:AAA domain-containing protein [Panacagrimonas perspica]